MFACASRKEFTFQFPTAFCAAFQTRGNPLRVLPRPFSPLCANAFFLSIWWISQLYRGALWRQNARRSRQTLRRRPGLVTVITQHRAPASLDSLSLIVTNNLCFPSNDRLPRSVKCRVSCMLYNVQCAGYSHELLRPAAAGLPARKIRAARKTRRAIPERNSGERKGTFCSWASCFLSQNLRGCIVCSGYANYSRKLESRSRFLPFRMLRKRNRGERGLCAALCLNKPAIFDVTSEYREYRGSRLLYSWWKSFVKVGKLLLRVLSI